MKYEYLLFPAFFLHGDIPVCAFVPWQNNCLFCPFFALCARQRKDKFGVAFAVALHPNFTAGASYKVRTTIRPIPHLLHERCEMYFLVKSFKDVMGELHCLRRPLNFLFLR